MLFWFLFSVTLLIILYSYEVHFLDGRFSKIKEFLLKEDLKKKMNCECVFKGSFFFKIGMYDVYEDENIIILIKNFGLLNGLMQRMFPENFIIVKSMSDLEETFKSNFLKFVRINSIEDCDGCMKIQGQLYTKLFFNNNFNYEREIILTISGY